MPATTAQPLRAPARPSTYQVTLMARVPQDLADQAQAYATTHHLDISTLVRGRRGHERLLAGRVEAMGQAVNLVGAVEMAQALAHLGARGAVALGHPARVDLLGDHGHIDPRRMGFEHTHDAPGETWWCGRGRRV